MLHFFSSVTTESNGLCVCVCVCVCPQSIEVSCNLVNCNNEEKILEYERKEEQTNQITATTVCYHNERLFIEGWCSLLLWSPASLKGRFWTLAWLFGHNGHIDSAKATFKLKVRPVCAAEGQSLGLDLCFCPHVIPAPSLRDLKGTLKLTYKVLRWIFRKLKMVIVQSGAEKQNSLCQQYGKSSTFFSYRICRREKE